MTLLAELERSVGRHESAVVAFSGGVTRRSSPRWRRARSGRARWR
jgi:hypothetical protein